MKKTILAAGMMAALGVTGSANAVFTPLADGAYRMTIDTGCFAFGNCQGTPAEGNPLTDNATTNEANTSNFAITPNPPYGSGIVNDGFVGVIDFTLNSGAMTVTSFSQDSYQGTAGGTFYLRSTDNTTMGGSIDGSGNMDFDPTGRQGLAASFITTLGEQAWNVDDSSKVGAGNTNVYDKWTTGTSSNRTFGLTAGFTVAGTPLSDTGTAGEWTGTLVAAGNIGTAWGTSFDGTNYSEIFDVTVTAVPVPAAVWLFGSGLVGLVGVARRRKQA